MDLSYSMSTEIQFPIRCNLDIIDVCGSGMIEPSASSRLVFMVNKC
jgi:hypothetical protein